MKGTWDSIHVFEILNKSGSKADYKLTATIMLNINTQSERVGDINIGGNLQRQVSKDNVIVDNKDNTHLSNLGGMIENIESTMRQTLEQVYLGRTKDIVFDMRKKGGVAAYNASRDAQKSITGQLK